MTTKLPRCHLTNSESFLLANACKKSRLAAAGVAGGQGAIVILEAGLNHCEPARSLAGLNW